MVLNDFKVKAVECLINNFNAENERNDCTININGVSLLHINSVEIDEDFVVVYRHIDSYNYNRVLVACMSIDDINTMWYLDDCSNIVSLNNIEF